MKTKERKRLLPPLPVAVERREQAPDPFVNKITILP